MSRLTPHENTIYFCFRIHTFVLRHLYCDIYFHKYTEFYFIIYTDYHISFYIRDDLHTRTHFRHFFHFLFDIVIIIYGRIIRISIFLTADIFIMIFLAYIDRALFLRAANVQLSRHWFRRQCRARAFCQSSAWYIIFIYWALRDFAYWFSRRRAIRPFHVVIYFHYLAPCLGPLLHCITNA